VSDRSRDRSGHRARDRKWPSVKATKLNVETFYREFPGVVAFLGEMSPADEIRFRRIIRQVLSLTPERTIVHMPDWTPNDWVHNQVLGFDTEERCVVLFGSTANRGRVYLT